MTVKEFRAYISSRIAQGESQSEIAQSFGVSRQAVNRWLNEDIEPSGMALKFATTLQSQSATFKPE